MIHYDTLYGPEMGRVPADWPIRRNLQWLARFWNCQFDKSCNVEFWDEENQEWWKLNEDSADDRFKALVVSKFRLTLADAELRNPQHKVVEWIGHDNQEQIGKVFHTLDHIFFEGWVLKRVEPQAGRICMICCHDIPPMQTRHDHWSSKLKEGECQAGAKELAIGQP